jgi:hypothetical protein
MLLFGDLPTDVVEVAVMYLEGDQLLLCLETCRELNRSISAAAPA